MKKVLKSHNNLFTKEVTITIDESLNKLKGKVLAPHKLEQANRHLKKIRSLPK